MTNKAINSKCIHARSIRIVCGTNKIHQYHMEAIAAWCDDSNIRYASIAQSYQKGIDISFDVCSNLNRDF